MVKSGAMRLSALNTDELNGIVSIYPWYAGARMELCRRLASSEAVSAQSYGQPGSERFDTAGADKCFADTALYVCSRRLVWKLLRGRQENLNVLAEAAAEKVACNDSSAPKVEVISTDVPETTGREVLNGDEAADGRTAGGSSYRGVGDYFSRSQYEGVTRPGDNIFGSFASKSGEVDNSSAEYEEFNDFCTETLAQVYLEQGYPEQAREIYSKLGLRYPEKSIYFAALIDKIDNKI